MRRIDFKIALAIVAQIHFIAFAQLSALDKAEGFFYNKDYLKSHELYQSIIKNEYASKKDIAISKCRIALININEKDILQSQIYLEESLSENILSLPMTSICTYALLQVYVKFKKYPLAVSLVKVLESPNLQPSFLAKYYALASEAARFSMNKEFEKMQLKKLKELMKKQNYQSIALNKEENKRITVFDIEARLAVLNFEDDMSSEFSSEYVANVFIAKIRNGDYSTALEILEKKISPKVDSIVFDSGLSIKNAVLRSRLVHLLHDNPQEMRVGVILSNKGNRQSYNQNFLRGVAGFLASTAANGVRYTVPIENSKRDGGSLSEKAFKLIFEKHVHTLVVGEGFHDLNDIATLSRLFSIPLLIPNEQMELSTLPNDLKEMNSMKIISEKGKFKESFENLLQEKSQNLKVEAKVFDSFILLRNMQFLANGSQSADLEKIIRSGNWKVDGIAVYEGNNSIK